MSSLRTAVRRQTQLCRCGMAQALENPTSPGTGEVASLSEPERALSLGRLPSDRQSTPAGDTRRALSPKRAFPRDVILRPERAASSPALIFAGPKDLDGDKRGPGAAAAKMPASDDPHPPTST